MDALPAIPPVDLLTGAARSLDGARAAARSDDVQAAAREFEALFASLLVKELRRGLPQGFFGEGSGADVYSGWLDEHLGAALAKGRGLGMGEALQRDLGEGGR